MGQLIALALRSPRLILWFGAVVVAIATWCALESGKMSLLLFGVFLLSTGIVSFLGHITNAVFLAVTALVGALLFVGPVACCRIPKTPEQAVRFSLSTCLWLLVYLVALFRFGDFAI
jgi:hypothetical protein